MALIRFYNTGFPSYRDENTDENYEMMVHKFHPDFGFRGEVPAANISETEKEYSIKMALPGVDKKDIRVQHDKGYLTISIEKDGEKQESESYTRREFNFSGTSRSFKTGKGIETEKITAKHENGILTVHLPKTEPVTVPVQSIEIE